MTQAQTLVKALNPLAKSPQFNHSRARSTRARQLNLEWLEGRELLSVNPVVTTAADNGDNANPTPNSLRAAIIAVNNDTSIGADQISFDIANSGVQTIALTAPLPNITHPVAINGQTEPGFSTTSTPLVVIDGSGAGAGANGLTLTASATGSIIRGLSIVGFTSNSTTGAGGNGIYLAGTVGGDQVEGCYLGVKADGATVEANASGILALSPNNTIGGSTNLTRDVISGNGYAGALIAGSGNIVTGDYIGTDATGTVAAGNQYGVLVMSSNNIIGGTTAGAGNLISGNVGPSGQNGSGIIFEGQATANLVEGNEIGTNVTGTAALLPTNVFPAITYSNVYGIYFGTQGPNTSGDNIVQETIGGSTAAAGNLISGNVAAMSGALASSVIEGNTIGFNLAGTAVIPNNDGLVLGASQVTIGGTTLASRNVISGSVANTFADGAGIELSGDSDVIEGNYIGLSPTGLSLAGAGNAIGMDLDLTNSTIGSTIAGDSNLIAGNLGDAIELGVPNFGIQASYDGSDAFYGNVIGLNIQGAADANGGNGIFLDIAAPTGTAPTTPLALNDTIGGTAAGQANTISHGGGAGILVNSSYPTGVTGLTIRGNSIFGNAKLGIDLAGTGSPIPTTLFINGFSQVNNQLTVTGVYFAAPGTTVTIDLFANAADPSATARVRSISARPR